MKISKLWRICIRFFTRDSKASDKRDLVYALLGLVKDTDISDFHVTYVESLESLSHRASLYILDKHGILALLGKFSWQGASGHPSWMIKLDDRRTLRHFEALMLHKATSQFRAGGDYYTGNKLEDNKDQTGAPVVMPGPGTNSSGCVW